MSFRVLMSCRDCTGEDPQGCFDGGTEYLNDGAEFETYELASAAGHAAKGFSPWEFEIVDENGETVEPPA